MRLSEEKPKIPFRLIVLALFITALTACPSNKDADNSSLPGNARTFYVLDFDNGERPYQLSADLYGVSPSVLVYVESGRTAAASAAQTVADTFDRAIYDVVRSNYGAESDFDQNGRVIVLLLDIKDGFSGDGAYIAGYSDPTDIFVTERSNKADMIYIDVDPGQVGSETFFRTVAHEFQHLVNFVENYVREGGNTQDTWINEGLSLSAEYLYAGSHTRGRIEDYNADDGGSIALGNSFFVWDDGDVLADYATAYIFFQWLRIHASNGAGIYRDIIGSSYHDYRAVEEASALRISDGAVTIDELIRDWYLAIRFRDDVGIYGFRADPVLNSLNFHRETVSENAITLAPGEGVFNVTNGSLTPSDPDPLIGYVGLGVSSSVRDAIGAKYDGDLVLVWNRDTNNDPDDPNYELRNAPLSTTAAEPDFPTNTTNSGRGVVSSSTTNGARTRRIYPIGVRRGAPFDGEMARDGK